jgi:hypothetical protein
MPEFQTSRKEPETQSLTSSSDESAHLDDIVMRDISDGSEDLDAPVSAEEYSRHEAEQVEEARRADLITPDQFWVYFQGAFAAPGALMPDFRPLGIQPDEEYAARKASDSLHWLLDKHFPFMLEQKNETIAHLSVCLPFLYVKVMVVREIFRARKAQPVEGRAAPGDEVHQKARPDVAPAADGAYSFMDAEAPVQ